MMDVAEAVWDSLWWGQTALQASSSPQTPACSSQPPQAAGSGAAVDIAVSSSYDDSLRGLPSALTGE